MKVIIKLLAPIFGLAMFCSCQDEGFEESAVAGLWKQVSVTEDGMEIDLTPEQQSCQLLIDPNGICRYYHQAFKTYANNPTTFYGTWSILDGQWINFNTDKWKFNPSLSSDSSKVTLTYKKVNGVSVIDTVASARKQWTKYHIQSRFTILRLTADEMEIRLKTFVGEKKYALLFAPDPADFIEFKNMAAGTVNYNPKLVTDDNYWIIRKEFQTLKTYVYTFKRVTY